MFERMLKCALIVAALGAYDGIARAQDSASLLGPDGQDACYGRVYDDAHLKAHPDQKMQRIFLFHGHDPVDRPDEAPPPHQSSSYTAWLSTSTRGQRSPKWVGTWCRTEAADGGPTVTRCGMECDRTLGTLTRDAEGRILLSGLSRDLYLDPDAEETLGKAEYARQAFGKGDDNFALVSMPASACMAEFAKIDPPDPALGPPLRERLKPDAAFCYGRDYDGPHMASHPAQAATSIRVFRGPAQLASFARDAKAADWPNNAEIVVRMTSRKGGAAATKTYVCQGVEDQWDCAPTSDCDLARRDIYLRRAVKGAMMLSNPESALPLVDTCDSDTKGATKTDDKTFRIDPMPLAACGL